ncbi:hypothetical protein VTN77DRAFT_4927 [Rasamsonia byssochlamydoides]|uniref:uncharacterized protein n=1 Tax=Rasamsonia byssochlamydoides TaxID=89139 RepID=UPI0037427A11
MASRGFSFPPPPPPPPQQHAPGFQTPAASYGQNNTSYGPRGGRPSGGYHRGRGRGNGNRGGRGGSHTAPYHANSAVNYGGYSAASTLSTPSTVTGASPYHHSSQFQPPQTQPAYPPPGQPYSQPPPSLPPYSSHPNYDAGYGASSSTAHSQVPSYSSQSPAGYAPAISPPPHSSSPASHVPPGAPLVAPPMRWGYDNSGAGGFYPGPSNGSTSNSLSRPGYTHPGGNNFTKHGHKRAFSSAFEKPTNTVPRTPAPPPVPSFGNPLPAKPPPPADAARKPKKKKRRFNQLGLTPKTEEHESSEEEDDVDEEARLAPGTATGPLQFTYKGRTSTLQSPAEIAAWIEERKKRYPTKARIEEKKKAMEEARKQKEMQREEARRKQKEARAQKERAKSERKEQEQSIDPIDAAVKAKLKAEKLRKKLMKEEKRLAKAEADAERARLRAEALQQGQAAKPDETGPEISENVGGDSSTQVDTAQTGSDAAHPVVNGTDGVQAVDGKETDLVTSSSQNHLAPPVDASVLLSVSSPGPDTSDETSSSGSDLSSSDSDDDSDDDDDDDDEDGSAPEEISSRRDGPERVPAPSRENRQKKKRLCRHFARTGRCSRGDRCRFSHELPEGGAVRRPGETKGRGQTAKRGLFQLLMAREAEERDRRVMQAIAWLGEHGLLDEPTNEATSKPSSEIPPVHQEVYTSDAAGVRTAEETKAL